MNQSWPFQSVRLASVEDARPGVMSFTMPVPAPVPSLLHSSVPWIPSSAVK